MDDCVQSVLLSACSGICLRKSRQGFGPSGGLVWGFKLLVLVEGEWEPPPPAETSEAPIQATNWREADFSMMPLLGHWCQNACSQGQKRAMTLTGFHVMQAGGNCILFFGTGPAGLCCPAPGYYSRFGFRPALEHGFEPAHPIKAEHEAGWMVLFFKESAGDGVKGKVQCAGPLDKAELW